MAERRPAVSHIVPAALAAPLRPIGSAWNLLRWIGGTLRQFADVVIMLLLIAVVTLLVHVSADRLTFDEAWRDARATITPLQTSEAYAQRRLIQVVGTPTPLPRYGCGFYGTYPPYHCP